MKLFIFNKKNYKFFKISDCSRKKPSKFREKIHQILNFYNIKQIIKNEKLFILNEIVLFTKKI